MFYLRYRSLYTLAGQNLFIKNLHACQALTFVLGRKHVTKLDRSQTRRYLEMCDPLPPYPLLLIITVAAVVSMY